MFPLFLAQAYNSRYSGGGDWEDHGLMPTQAKSSRDPISKLGWIPTPGAHFKIRNSDYAHLHHHVYFVTLPPPIPISHPPLRHRVSHDFRQR
jgi:hypothetical protein